MIVYVIINYIYQIAVNYIMKLRSKIVFILFLAVFVGASVYFSFDTIARPTYEFEYKTEINGTSDEGWAFIGFNGNQNTKEVRIDYMRDSNGENPDKSKPISLIDSYTFVSDEYVEYIYIGKDVKYINERAFVYCKQLRAIFVDDDDNPYFTDINGILFSKDMKKMILYPICYCTHIVYSDIEQNGEVTGIGMDYREAFRIKGSTRDEQYTDLKSKVSDDISRELFDELVENGVMAPYIGTYYVIAAESDGVLAVKKYWSSDETYSIPEGVEKIEANCFYKCDRLQKIDLASTVKEIGDMAFFKCTGISLVTLPNGLEKIGSDAFSYCESMKYSIFIPESVEEIEHHAFYQCDNLTAFFLCAKDESAITLGGSWQPKDENAFKANPPVFNSSPADCEEYNAEMNMLEEKKKQPQVIPEPSAEEILNDTDGKYSKVRSDNADINYTVVTLLIIFVFVPCSIMIIVEVVRNMFKPDFLMTKKQKERVRLKKEKAERLKEEYIKLQKIKTEGEEING